MVIGTEVSTSDKIRNQEFDSSMTTCLYHRQRLFCFIFVPLFRELRGSICESSGTVRFRRARNRLTLRPTCKVATDHRVYVWAHGTAKVYKRRNATMRGIRQNVHP